MTKRVAIYARYSTDLQSENSIEDQFRVCREYAKREGWEVVDTYFDRALSGANMMRAGIQALMQDSMDGKFDVVLSEALDRLSRDQEDIAHIYKRMKFADIDIFTLSEGLVDEMLIGFKGTMNQLYIKELASKTRRGLKGRALEGKSVGGRAFGYITHKEFNQKGEVIKEERRIVENEAAIVVRIFEEYAKGKSPRKIAADLNAEGVKAPNSSGWGASTINGNRKRGNGIVNNELYAGRMIWNRQRFVKNPKTGARISKMNPESEWVITEIPELRIVSQELWDKAKDFQTKIEHKKPLHTKQRAPKLLSHLLKCGCCGGGMSMISATHYGCSNARNKGTCENRVTISLKKLEERVLSTLRTRLMDSELTEIFCKEYFAHINRLRMSHNSKRQQNETELNKVQREINKLIECIKNGIDPTLIKDEINGLQKRKEVLTDLLNTTEEAPVYIHPKMGERYAKAIENLITSLNKPEHKDESALILRELIEKIILTPSEDKSALVVDLYGDLAGILQISKSKDDKIIINPKHALNKKELVEIEQVHEVSKSHQTLVNAELSGSQVMMVAGAGFEPAAFRL